jgi:hypothetical protein
MLAAQARARGWSCGCGTWAVQERRGKAGASAGPAAGGGGIAAWACRSRMLGEVAAQDDNVQGNDAQGDSVQGGGVQRRAVSPLGELRPRPGWCAGRLHAVREEL